MLSPWVAPHEANPDPSEQAVLLLLVPGTATAGGQWAGVAGVGSAKE